MMSVKSRSSRILIWRRADSTIASGVAVPYFCNRSFSSDPPLTPIRIGTFRAWAARTTSTMRSCFPMLPGFKRNLSMPASSASSASL